MAERPPAADHRAWFRRSLALTLAVGAVLLLLVAARPGYTAFYVTSTFSFLLAGLLWPGGGPPWRRPRARAQLVARVPLTALAPAQAWRLAARTYRVSTAR
jgi:hypothetical protein